MTTTRLTHAAWNPGSDCVGCEACKNTGCYGRFDNTLKDLLKTAAIDNVDEVYAVVRTAKTLAELLDVALLDENGNLLAS